MGGRQEPDFALAQLLPRHPVHQPAARELRHGGMGPDRAAPLHVQRPLQGRRAGTARHVPLLPAAGARGHGRRTPDGHPVSHIVGRRRQQLQPAPNLRAHHSHAALQRLRRGAQAAARPLRRRQGRRRAAEVQGARSHRRRLQPRLRQPPHRQGRRHHHQGHTRPDAADGRQPSLRRLGMHLRHRSQVVCRRHQRHGGRHRRHRPHRAHMVLEPRRDKQTRSGPQPQGNTVALGHCRKRRPRQGQLPAVDPRQRPRQPHAEPCGRLPDGQRLSHLAPQVGLRPAEPLRGPRPALL